MIRNTKVISASISNEFYKLALDHGISWSEAMRIGLAIIFLEKGIIPETNINKERIKKLNNLIIKDKNE